MTKTFLILLASAASGSAHAAPPSACPIERAVYRQTGNPQTTMGFTHQRVRSNYTSDLVLWVKSGKQQFWFGFSSPNGYGGTYISPQIDPRLVKANGDETPDDSLPGATPAEGKADDDSGGGMMFDAFDANMKAMDGPPQKGDRAPARIFARELGPLFHYAHNGTLYKLSAPVRIDRQMWTLSSCSPKPN